MKQGYILLEDKLKGEYREAFSQVEYYGSTKWVDADVSAEMLMELLDQMLEAQNAGRPVTDIVGKDIQEFCRNFYSEYKLTDRFGSFCKMLYRFAWILFVLALLGFFFPEDAGEAAFQSDIAPIITGGICGAVVAPILFWLILKILECFMKVNDSVRNAVSCIVLIVTFVFAIALSSHYDIYIPSVVAFVISVIYIIGYLAVRAISNYKKYGAVRAPKQEELGFWDTVNSELDDEMIFEWQKQLVKKNERLQKKGKPLMAEETFLAKLDKQYDPKRVLLVNALIFWGVTLIAITLFSVFGKYESWGDYAMFLISIIGVEAGVYYGLYKAEQAGIASYANMKRQMAEQGMTMMELAEYLAKEK